jgi:hypothetical protein
VAGSRTLAGSSSEDLETLAELFSPLAAILCPGGSGALLAAAATAADVYEHSHHAVLGMSINLILLALIAFVRGSFATAAAVVAGLTLVVASAAAVVAYAVEVVACYDPDMVVVDAVDETEIVVEIGCSFVFDQRSFDFDASYFDQTAAFLVGYSAYLHLVDFEYFVSLR